MKFKCVFAIYGPAKAGKSSTVKRIFEQLTRAYPTAPVQQLNPPGGDITVILEIDGVYVGIESEGDPGGRLSKSVRRFRAAGCSMIVCATRTRGSTVDIVERLQPEFTIFWHAKTREPRAQMRNQADQALARVIFAEIQKLLKRNSAFFPSMLQEAV